MKIVIFKKYIKIGKKDYKEDYLMTDRVSYWVILNSVVLAKIWNTGVKSSNISILMRKWV
jgi:hypothetical protein